jgi:hypothetical protein
MEPDNEVEAFAARVKRAWNRPAYERLRADLRSRPDRGKALLEALTRHRSQEVCVWAAGVARHDLGPDAIPILVSMAHDRRTATRDAAMQDLEAIDPELLRPFVPDMRHIFNRSKDLNSEGRAAMWRLARLRDAESAELFRRYAESRNPASYDHRMPMVLADYVEDPTSLVRRLKAHDHDWTFWVARAAKSLLPTGAEEALREASQYSPDAKCREICADELENLELQRTVPNSNDWSSIG